MKNWVQIRPDLLTWVDRWGHVYYMHNGRLVTPFEARRKPPFKPITLTELFKATYTPILHNELVYKHNPLLARIK